MTMLNVGKDVEQLECLVNEYVKCEEAALGNSLKLLRIYHVIYLFCCCMNEYRKDEKIYLQNDMKISQECGLPEVLVTWDTETEDALSPGI